MSKEYPFGTGKLKWTSTEWLEKNLGGDFHIVDCQPNIHDYIKEHIPGAVYMNPEMLRIPKNGTPGNYIDKKAMESHMRRLGLSAEYPVVVYTGKGTVKGWGDGLEQTMVAYSFVRFGHQNVWILDGGLDKWKAEGRKLTQDFPSIDESKFSAKVQSDFFVEYDKFKKLKEKKDTVLLDARPAAVYEGQGPWRKPGHIPGAINLPWKSLMDADNPRMLKSREEIEAILQDKGITSDKTIICSCGTGREATNEFILFKWFFGWGNVKIYEGSFTEWTSYPENPTVTGPNPT